MSQQSEAKHTALGRARAQFGIMVADLRHFGTTRGVLKISVRTSFSCSAQPQSTHPGMLSWPVALQGLVLDMAVLMLVGVRHRWWDYQGRHYSRPQSACTIPLLIN